MGFALGFAFLPFLSIFFWFVEAATELCVAYISFFRFFSSPIFFSVSCLESCFLCGITGDTWVANFLATSFYGLGFIDVGKRECYFFIVIVLICGVGNQVC